MIDTMRTHALISTMFALGLAAASGCGDSEVVRPREGGQELTLCERYDALSMELGCAPLADACELPPDCESAGHAWFDCLERDTSQCMCEEDDGEGDLNCEGSFKEDEGPALCRAEYAEFDACLARFEEEDG